MRVWDAAIATGKHGLHQHSGAEVSMRRPAPFNQSTSQSPDLGVGNTSLLGGELEKYSPQRAPSGELILKDGWIVGSADELLLWVPPVHRTHLGKEPEWGADSRPWTIDPTIVLDFRSFKCGKEWTQCRSSGAQ